MVQTIVGKDWDEKPSGKSILLWETEPNLKPIVAKWWLVNLKTRKSIHELVIQKILADATFQVMGYNSSIMDVWIHDLRRTFGSYQSMGGTSLHIIGKSLGHKSIAATQVYARLQMEPFRNSVEKAIDQMFCR